MQDQLLAIVGPTAVGKSSLALKLATRLDGEIIGADSRQVYRGLDIGTATPSAKDRSSVPHHLVNTLSPNEDYSLALFIDQARKAIQDIHSRSRLPIVVGGTGQYAKGLIEGWQVPAVLPDRGLRRRLEKKAADCGPGALFADLVRLAPETAARVDPKNVRRVVRALEIEYDFSWSQPRRPRKIPPRYQMLVIGLTVDRPKLFRRIDERVDAMIKAGWINEVSELLGQGYSPETPALSSLGYGELVGYLNGQIALSDAVQQIKYRTHKFARSQYAWFRLRDEQIHWFDAENELEAVEEYIALWSTRSEDQCPPAPKCL